MRTLRWVGVILGTVLLGVFFYLWRLAGDISLTTAVLLDGPMECSGPRFRVGVMGDAQKGLSNLSRITRTLLDEGSGFLLQTGDLVSSNDEGHYRLAELYLGRGGARRWPFVAPGNHDVKGGTDLFQFKCGALERAFTVGSVAFVILNNANGSPPDPVHIDQRIREAGPHERVILAMHVPPFDEKQEVRPGYQPFLEWLKGSKVAYLLCGHVHGYFKKQVGETTVLVNGVGGDSDKWQWDQKVFGTILEIDGPRISDRAITLEPTHEFRENVEHLAAGHFVEAYGRRPVLCWLGTLVLIGGVGWGWVRLLRRPGIPKVA